MRKQLAKERASHAAEPEPGSFRAVTGDGDDADLFNLDHYPVHAVCLICNEPIYAEAFLRAFRHRDLEPGLPGGEGQAVTGQHGGQ
jgi:hypothetical protein